MDIVRRKHTRNVRRNLEASLKQSPRPAESAPDWNQELKPQRKKRGVWKKLLIIFMILVLLGMGVALGSYFYIKTAPIAGENSGRVNILVLGVDSAARLSDTIMVVSVDTRTGHEPRLAMISLPRDLFVQIPPLGGSKINAAYSYGENSDYKGGGIALAKDTIETNFNLKIHHYAVLNFDGLRDLVDAVDGVDVEIKEDLTDPQYPNTDYSGYDPFSISAGRHHLNGDSAIKVARCRNGTCGNDYGRAARQQQIIVAVKDKITSPSTLLNPNRIRKIKAVIEDNLKTDLSLRQLAKLYLLFRAVDQQNVTRHVLDTSNYLVSDGSSLTPRTGDFSEINEFIENIFSKAGDTLPESEQD